MAGEGNLKCSFSAWALASLFTYDFLAPAALCIEQQFAGTACPGEMTFPRGEQAGKAASFWGKTSLCLFSGFRAWPGAVEMGPLSSEGLWRPRLLISRFSSFKGPISFQQEEFICKAPRRSQPNWRWGGGGEVGLWLDLSWEQSRLLFADLFLQGLGSPTSTPCSSTPCSRLGRVSRRDQGHVRAISWGGDDGLLCPSVTLCSLGAAEGTLVHHPNSTRRR